MKAEFNFTGENEQEIQKLLSVMVAIFGAEKVSKAVQIPAQAAEATAVTATTKKAATKKAAVAVDVADADEEETEEITLTILKDKGIKAVNSVGRELVKKMLKDKFEINRLDEADTDQYAAIAIELDKQIAKKK